MRLTAYGSLLAASPEDRTLTYLLLPYGEEGRTNLGRVTASRGSVQLPEDPTGLVGNLEHQPTRPISKCVALEETDDGLRCSVRVLPTSAGDDLLIEAAEGVRTGISVEIEDPVIRDGALVAGRLVGYGHVTTPAFPSAQLAAAEDTGDLPDWLADTESATESVEEIVVDGQTYVRTTVSTYKTETTPKADDEADDTEEEEENPMTETTVNASAPADLTASAPRPRAAQESVSARQVAELLAAAHARPGDTAILDALRGLSHTALFAALSDIKHDGTSTVGANIRQPGWLGELWSGRQYRRRYMTLFGPIRTLDSIEVKGWKWGTKPAGGAWNGNKAAVPTNTPTTTPYTKKANRWAGGHDIAREYVDFPNPEFWESYVRAMNESYAKDSDEGFLGEIVSAATPVEVGTVPDGVSEALVKIVDGALAVLEYGVPAFAVVARPLWREFILTPKDETLEYLSTSLGLEEGQVENFRVLPCSTDDLADTQVLVGAAEAAEARELPGETPLRVDALNLVNGGVDNAFFGYWTSIVHEAGALALVDDPEA